MSKIYDNFVRPIDNNLLKYSKAYNTFNPNLVINTWLKGNKRTNEFLSSVRAPGKCVQFWNFY